jgi:type IV pilus secretin PilQ/predicted competence protein
MRIRLVPTNGLNSAARASHFKGWALLFPLLMLAVPRLGMSQAAAGNAKLPKTAENLEVSYLGAKDAVAKPHDDPAAFITSITTSQEGRDLAVSIGSSRELAYQEFNLDGPPRLVLDFMNAEIKVTALNYPAGAAGVKQLRIRQFQTSEPKIARLVFDLDKNYGSHEVTADAQGMRITFHAAESSAQAKAQASSAPPAPRSSQAGARQPGMQQQVAATSRDEAKEETPGSVVPVISDLASSEISQTALASATAEPSVQVGRPQAKAKAPASVQPPPLPTPAAPAHAASPRDGEFSGEPLSLDLVNISLVDFFRLMAEEGGINIVMDPDIKGTTSIKVEKVPWDQIFEAVVSNNGLDKQIDGNLVRIVTKKTMQAEAKQQEDLKKATLLAADVDTRIRRLNYAKATDLLTVLKEQLSPRGTAVVDERSGSLVITDIPSSLDKVMKLIDGLDKPEPQVEIEARIVSANRNFARDIGIQFGFIQGNLDRVTVGGANTSGTIGGTRPSNTPGSTFAAGNETTGRGASISTSSGSGGVSTGTSAANNSGNWNVNLPAALPFGGLGLSVGNIFDTFLLDAAITAGESKGQAKLISQPKLTTQNNSPGTITQGLRFPVQVVANNTVTIQFQNAALTLTVTPQITSEGNIVLDLKIENNTPDFADAVLGVPSIRTSESQSRVLVSDGGTTVIGGILIDSEQSSRDGIPGLASLPILGNLFRRSAVSHNTQEVLFFITPKIVK